MPNRSMYEMDGTTEKPQTEFVSYITKVRHSKNRYGNKIIEHYVVNIPKPIAENMKLVKDSFLLVALKTATEKEIKDYTK